MVKSVQFEKSADQVCSPGWKNGGLHSSDVYKLIAVPKAVKAKTKAPRKRAPRKTPDLDKVIEIAIQLVFKHGESGFRIEELIELSGISKSSLYLHFGDRDGLVGAALSAAYVEDITVNVDIDSEITAKDLDKWRAVLESVYKSFLT